MGRKTNHKKRYENSGRPTVMTPDVLSKLEDAFRNAFTDDMACLYAGISDTSLYRYCEENEAFRDRKEQLKQSPHLIAQKELVSGIQGNLSQARWWAEHRMPDFMPKASVIIGGTLKTEDSNDMAEQKRLVREFRDKLKQSIINRIKNKK